MAPRWASLIPAVAAGFRSGGVDYADHVAATEGRMGASWRHVYDEQLVDGFLAAGTGHAITALSAAFPATECVGLDIAPEAITAAEAERDGLGLVNARFLVGDAADPLLAGPYDVALAFDAIHDQQRPDTVLRRVHDVLAPDGVFVMVDTKFAGTVEDNAGNPYAPMAYAISTMFCVPSTLARGGAADARGRRVRRGRGAGLTAAAELCPRLPDHRSGPPRTVTIGSAARAA